MISAPHPSGKRYQFTCAIPNIEVLQRMAIEGRLKRDLPSHSVVADGDTDFDEWKRLFMFTDNPNDLVNVLGKTLAKSSIDITECRCFRKDLLEQTVPIPALKSADDVETTTIVDFLETGTKVLGEAMKKHAGNLPKLRQYVETRWKFIACSRVELAKVQFAGYNIPAGDQFGLISMWTLACANKNLFPTMFGEITARTEWQKNTARPR